MIRTLDRKNTNGKQCGCGRQAIKYSAGWVCARCSKLERSRQTVVIDWADMPQRQPYAISRDILKINE